MSDTRNIANIGKWSSYAAGALTLTFALALVFDYNSNVGI